MEAEAREGEMGGEGETFGRVRAEKETERLGPEGAPMLSCCCCC